MTSFVRGFSSVLSLYGNAEDKELRFEYDGLDLAQTTIEQALQHDWSSITDTSFEVNDGEDE